MGIAAEIMEPDPASGSLQKAKEELILIEVKNLVCSEG